VLEAWAIASEGRLEPALEAIKDNEDPLAASFVRGLGLLARGQPAVAAGQFRRALDLSSELLPAAFYLAACAAAEGKDREAVGGWQTALVTETAPVVYRLLADALLRLDDVEAATGVLREGVAAWPRDDALVRRLGLTLAAQGEGKEALRLLSASLDRGPADPGALLVALHLLFEAHASGQAGPEDGERLGRYARAYAAAGGPQKELVALWERHLSRQR
jgi:tetratricopeptide (TPR) repeat protein